MDIAEALSELSRAAEARRDARRDLRATSELIASGITPNLRVGDEVTVNGHEYRVDNLTWYVKIANGNSIKHPKGAPVLLMDGKPLHDARQPFRPTNSVVMAPVTGSAYVSKNGDTTIPGAGDSFRAQFLADALEVVEAFKRFCLEDLANMQNSADLELALEAMKAGEK